MQVEQPLAPVAPWYWPAGHAVQLAAVPVANRPAAQLVQPLAPAAEYLPAAHADAAYELMPVAAQ